MFHVNDVIQLQPAERVHAVVRSHVAFLWLKLSLSLVCLVVPFFFLFHLLHAGLIGFIILLIFVGIGIITALRSFFLWDANVLVLTSTRLVSVTQRRLWHRAVSETTLGTIRDIQWERGSFFESLFHTGTIRIKTGAGSVPDLIATHLPEPEGLVRAMIELRDHPKPVKEHLLKEVVDEEVSLDERREQIHAWVSEASKEALLQIEGIMKR